MGVFARLLRRSKATEEARAAEVQAGAGVAAEEDTAGAKGSAEAGTAETAQESTAPESGETTADGGVEIPKQQSVEEAADSEAAEGART